MGKIKKILENELVGGTQQTDIYPVTSTKAVYDEQNRRLSEFVFDKNNVTQVTGISGDKVMSQRVVSEKLSSKITMALGKNLIYADEELTEGYINQSGIISPNADYGVTDYIPVDSSTDYFFSDENNNYPGQSNNVYWALYSKDYELLKTGRTTLISTTSETRYIRCTLYNNSHKAMLEKGSTRGEYEAGNPIHKYLQPLVDELHSDMSIIGNEVLPYMSKSYTGEHGAYTNIYFSNYPLKAGGKIINRGIAISVYEVKTNIVKTIKSGSTYTLPVDMKGTLMTSNVSGSVDFDFIYYAVASDLDDYVTKEEFNSISSNLSDIITDTKAEIGVYTEEKELHLKAGAYGDINRINIPTGSTINNSGGYIGELLLCPEENFTINNYTRISTSKLPYVTTFDIKSIRSVSAIDNTITYTIPATGVKKDIETLSTKVDNLSISAKPIGSTYRGDITAGQTIILEKNSVKGDESFAFSGNIETFEKILIGRGIPSEKSYSSSWFEIDNANIVYKEYYTETNHRENSYPHGLTITNNIQILLNVGYDGKATVTLLSNGQMFKKEVTWNGYNGKIFVQSVNAITNASFSWTCKKLNSDIWLFGDSYFSITSTSRWTSYLLSNGYKNLLINGYPGEDSVSALSDLQVLLSHRTPKYIVWCLGMNDADSSTAVNSRWLSSFNTLKELCSKNGIILIATTIPTVKGGYVEDTQNYNKREHKFKNEIVKSSGLRYIDFYSAVVKNGETGEWYSDMLYSDGVHPSVTGASALFMRAISDCPELLAADNY